MSDNFYQNNNQVVNGSIVGGDLTINQAISPEMILEPIQNILTYIRHRKPSSAQEILTALLSTSHLDGQAKGMLDVLALLIALAQAAPPEDAYSKVTSFLKKERKEIFVDIASSALMRLDIYGNRLIDAENRYAEMASPGEYCQEVFFEYISDESKLEMCFKNNAHQLSESVLCGVARGLLRCTSHELAMSASERLNTIYPCFNSKVVRLVVKCAHLGQGLNSTNFWLISNSSRKQAFLLADEISDLIRECKGLDYRVVGQAYSFLHFFYGDHKGLVVACWSYITNIEPLSEEFSRYLRSLMEIDFEDGPGFLNEIKRSKSDFLYRNSLIQRLSQSAELSPEDMILFGRVAEDKVIKDWVGRGGVVNASCSLEQDFIAIELQCYADDGNRSSKESIKKLAEEFLVNYKDSLHTLNLPRLLDITSKLMEVGLSPQVVALLQPIVPKVDIWPSPIVRNYLHALLDSDQLATLKIALSEIHQDEWDIFIWQMKARQLDLARDIPSAIKAIENALKLSPRSLQCWHHWVFLNKRNIAEDNESLLDKVPNEIFTNKSQSKLAWQILFEIAAAGNFSKIEGIVISWFIRDPNSCAKQVTDFHFARSFSGGKSAVDTVSSKTEYCFGGYSYTIDGRPSLRLITQGVDVNHSCILDGASLLGKALLEQRPGQTFQHGMQEVKLLEVLPPYVAMIRLALELRQANNDGSDCFYSFMLPDDPDEMITYLERKMQALDGGHDKHLIYGNPQIPLFLKAHLLGNDCPVHSALDHLTNKKSIKLPLPTVGENHQSGVIIDIYAATYLGLTGLIHGFIELNLEFFITVETRDCLRRFIERISSDNYMRIGLTAEGRLWRVTSKDLQSEIDGVLLAINYILKSGEVIYPNIVDMPPSILQVEDAMDDSTYSSLRLSISNDLPWLCIDEIFAQLSFKSGYRVVNAKEFFCSIGKDIEISKKLPGLYCHVSSGLPYSLTYEEILQIANLGDEQSQYYLAEILSMYPNAYAEIRSAVDHLSRIIILTITKAYVDGQILNGLRACNPRNNGMAERIFNVCCYLSLQVKDGGSAENKLAFLFYTLIKMLNGAEDIVHLIKILGSNFAAGHFLNFDSINEAFRACQLKED